jgi:hypothetical protein
MTQSSDKRRSLNPKHKTKEDRTEEHKKKDKHPDQRRDMLLSPKDARGGSPADVSVGGEEDVGGGLEFLVNRNDD